MNKENMKVLINIIGAVESGGQIYGNRRYNAYSPPYANTSNEHTITLGWAQNYGYEAKKLIQMIYDKDPAAFKKIDTSGTIQSMLSKDWVAIKWNPNSTQKNILIKLIDSQIGHTCQDELFASLMNTFITSCANDYTKDVKAQMMYCEIRHLGGKGPADRIFKRCGGNYSMDNIMAALKKDQSDTSSSNQVGDKLFWSRHQKCYEFINKYAVTEKTGSNTKVGYDVNKLISVATAEIGYLEKKSNSNLDNKTANAGSGNYTKYWRDIKPAWQGQAWCDCFVDWCFMKAYGAAAAQKLECGGYGVYYTPDSADCYKAKKQWYTSPKVGDQIFFRNDERICHTGIVVGVTGNEVTTIEGNTSGANTLVANGGGVKKKTYSRSYERIAGYGRPDYTGTGTSSSSSSSGSSSSSSNGSNITKTSTKEIQHMLNVLGWKLDEDGAFGAKTTAAVKEFQKKNNLEVDGIVGEKTLAALKKAYDAKQKPSNSSSTELTVNTTGKYNETVKKQGQITTLLNIRKGPGKNYTNLTSYPTLPQGTKIGICDKIKGQDGSYWYYILYNNKHGFASANYIKVL